MNTLVLAALSAGLATASTLTYTDFSTVAGLTLNGDATQIGNALRLVRTSERGGLQSERLLTIRTSLRGSPTIPSRSCFNVYLNTTSSQPLSPVMSANLDLAGTIGASNMFVGFGAGTGGAFGDNDILNSTFTTTECRNHAASLVSASRSGCSYWPGSKPYFTEMST